MSFKRDLLYYESRLKDQSLLLRAVRVRVSDNDDESKTDRFLCVPCGGDRVTGFTHFFKTKTQANIVYSTLLNSGENFPMLRVVPIVNMFNDHMFKVEWGVEEPDRRIFKGWDFEVAIAKQLGYSEECMDAHYERCKNVFF